MITAYLRSHFAHRVGCHISFSTTVHVDHLSQALAEVGKDGSTDAFHHVPNQIRTEGFSAQEGPDDLEKPSEGLTSGGKPRMRARERIGDCVVKAAKREVQIIQERSRMGISQKERLTLKEFRKFTNGVNARTTWYKYCSKEELDALARNLMLYVDDMGERAVTWSIYEFAKLKHRNDEILTALGNRFVQPRKLQNASRQNLCYALFGFALLGFDNMEITGKIVKQLASPQLVYDYRKDQLLMIAAALHKLKWPDLHVRTIFAKECQVRREEGKFKVNEQVAWLLDSTGVAKSHFATRRKVVRD